MKTLGSCPLRAFFGHTAMKLTLYSLTNTPATVRISFDQYNPDLIAFSFMTGNRDWAYATAMKIKQRFDTPIIFGGVHPTLFPEDIDFNYVDYLCIGEGEYPVLELMNGLEKGEDCSNIQNLWITKNGSLVKNPLRDLIQDFDTLPLPYREIYYKYTFH